MPVISACTRLLDCCLNGEPWPAALLAEVAENAATIEGSRALFSIVIERLADLFEPRLTLVYARLMTELIGRPELAARYETIRKPRVCFKRNPLRVYVLSRVTLGADIAVTSVVLDAAKRRFPHAEVYLVSSRKNWELFAGDPRILHRDVPYGRTALLADRLAACPNLDDPDAIVIDPDSRLSQLGLLPVCRDENYYFFESRAYGGDSNLTLSQLAAQWTEETFEVSGARAFIAPPLNLEPYRKAEVTVSLGIGENPLKRVADPFERDLLASLPENTIVDQGASDEESQRVLAAIRRGQRTFQGSFAAFASRIRDSSCFAGYDSAGGHVAAACGVPLISIFGGAVSERMFERWKPSGPGPIAVIRSDGRDAGGILEDVVATLERIRL